VRNSKVLAGQEVDESSNVTSEPTGAKVFVDNVYRGTLPFTITLSGTAFLGGGNRGEATTGKETISLKTSGTLSTCTSRI
jgi:hypothetical protein